MNGEMSDINTIGFVHIPKNAGTSIARYIQENNLPILVSNHWYKKQMAMEEIVVMRCPVDRFQSAFHYGKKYWANPVNRHFSSANELAESAVDPAHTKHALAWVEMGNKPADIYQRNLNNDPVHSVQNRKIDFTFVYEPQSSWMINEPKYILRFSDLEHDFAKLMSKLGYGNDFPLMRENRSDNNTDRYLSDKSLRFIRSIYKKDYARIDSLGLDL